MTAQTKEVTVKVTKETYEVFEGLAEVVKQAKLVGADGFQAVTDIPAVLLASLNKLSAAAAGLDALPEEIAALPEFIQGVGAGAGLIGAELAKKPGAA